MVLIVQRQVIHLGEDDQHVVVVAGGRLGWATLDVGRSRWTRRGRSRAKANSGLVGSD